MIVCLQGGTMPGMWYTLSLYLSGACQMMQNASRSTMTPVMTPAMHPHAWKHGHRPMPPV